MSQAIEKAPADNAPFHKRLEQALEVSKGKMLAVLPKYLTPEKMIQLAKTAVYRTPQLAECDPMTIVAAVVEAAELGLEIGGIKGEGYLIPRWNNKAKKNECNFQPGYRGLIKLALNSGEIKSIHAYAWHENDYFDYELGIDLQLIHKPCVGDRGKILGVYCAGRLSTGEPFAEVMDVATVERIRGYSQAGNSGPWANEWEEMARKSVLRRKLKTLPCSSEKLHKAIELDQREYVMPEPEERPMPQRKSETAQLQPAPEALTVTPQSDAEPVGRDESKAGAEPTPKAQQSSDKSAELRQTAENLFLALVQVGRSEDATEAISKASGVQSIEHVESGDLAAVIAGLQKLSKIKK
jgi:recombination protein RecT